MNKLIEEYINHEKLKGKSPLTLRNYRLNLLKFSNFANCSAEEIALDKIDQYQQQLMNEGLSLLSQSYHLIAIRNFLKFLKYRKDLKVLDPLKVDLPKIRRRILDALSEDEVKRLRRVAPVLNNYNVRARAILEFLLGSGIRVAELCRLKTTDIDLKERYFRVVGKGDKERVCFLNDTMVLYLRKYLATRSNQTSYLFSTYDRGRGDVPITTRSIERLITNLALKALISKQCSPHTLRRTFAIQLLRKGVDLRYIQEFLGHESIQTTTFYTKIERNDLEKVYRLANKKVVKDVKKDNEQVVISRESFQKLTGMIGKSIEQQNRILNKFEKKEAYIKTRLYIERHIN